MRGGTALTLGMIKTPIISIHPPRAGRDLHQKAADRFFQHFNPPAPCGAGPYCALRLWAQSHFNPPAPCGAGRHDLRVLTVQRAFQSTRPVRGGTCGVRSMGSADAISIHPPRAGRDLIMRPLIIMILLFQSTRPVRGGTIHDKSEIGGPLFQSTRPVRGGT